MAKAIAIASFIAAGCGQVARPAPDETTETTGAPETSAETTDTTQHTTEGQDTTSEPPPTFDVFMMDQGWECDVGHDNCWRELEVHGDGIFIARDAAGEHTFELSATQFDSIVNVVTSPPFKEAILDEEGVRCGSFFGDAIYFTVAWDETLVDRARVSGCLSDRTDIYSTAFWALAELRKTFVPCEDLSMPTYEQLQEISEGRIRGLCGPCSGNC